MNEGTVRRDEFLDSLKFFLIILVIFGHVLEAGKLSRFELTLYNTIYSFHMPLFIFVSGYFSKRYDNNKVFCYKILKLVETYIVFQLVLSLPSILSGEISASFLLRPYWILWYLFSLIIWRIMLQYIPLFAMNHWKIVICVSILMSLLCGFIPLSYDYSFQRTVTFLPFFMIGNICSNIKEIHYKELLPSKIVATIYFVFVFLSFYYVDKSFAHILYGSYCYTNILSLISRFIQILLGLLGGMCLMGLINGIKIPLVLNKIGSDTMFYFIYHAFFIIALKKLVTHYKYSLDFGVLVGIYILLLMTLYLLSKNQSLHQLLNPISSIYEKKSISSWWG